MPTTQPSNASYLILIGDSIAEGHPALHGRLHPPDGKLDLLHEDQPGQLGYELAQRLGIRVINQGIGGQSSVDTWKRWDRDVWGKKSDPGDGRGDTTINASEKLPSAVYVHVGINDFSLKVPLLDLKANFSHFAKTCRERHVPLIIDTIGAESDTRWFTPEVREAVHEFNRWLAGEFLVKHPEILLIDYCSWSTNGTGDLTVLRPGMFADDVHPSQQGYSEFASYAAERVRPFLGNAIAPGTTQPATTSDR